MRSKMPDQFDDESFIKLEGDESDSKQDQENSNVETDVILCNLWRKRWFAKLYIPNSS